jgi:hypothetical protein
VLLVFWLEGKGGRHGGVSGVVSHRGKVGKNISQLFMDPEAHLLIDDMEDTIIPRYNLRRVDIYPLREQ